MPHAPQDATTIRRLRQGVGIVGMGLPFAVTIGHSINNGETILLSSLSAAYYTQMRDVFVGSLCAVGVFLIFYRYTRVENILGTLAGLAAITVAFFPSTPGADSLIVTAAQSPTGRVHGIAALVLLSILAIFCFFLFPRSLHPSAMTVRKKARNVTYYLCGTAIVLGMASAALGSNILPDSVEATVRPMFWGETVAVLAFGVAWFARSNTLLPDVES